MVRVHHKLRSPLYRKARARIDDGGVPPLAGPMARSASGAFVIGIWGWFERIVLLATLISIAIGLWAFRIDYEDRVEDRIVRRETLTEIQDARAARREDAIARAWSLLTTPATGNSGKVAALEFLVAEKVPLIGIDLSCARMGGEENWNAETYTCLRPTYLRGAKIAGAMLDGANLSGVDLTGADMREVSMIGAHLSGAWIIDVDLTRGDLSASNLTGAFIKDSKLTQVSFRHVTADRIRAIKVMADDIDLTGARLRDADLFEFSAMSAQIGGADFSEAELLKVEMSMVEAERRTYLDDVRVGFKKARLCDVDFESADLARADFSEATLNAVRFDDGNLEESSFISAEVSDLSCEDAFNDIFGSGNGLGSGEITFKGASISGVKFGDLPHPEFLDMDRDSPLYIFLNLPLFVGGDFSGAWAWDNDPPLGRLVGQYKLCRGIPSGFFPGKYENSSAFPDPCLPPRGR